MDTLTDEGASGRVPKGFVEDGRESGLGALCSGNAGVADLDISHALVGGQAKQEEPTRQTKKRPIITPPQSNVVGEGRQRSDLAAMLQRGGMFQTGDGTKWELGTLGTGRLAESTSISQLFCQMYRRHELNKKPL